jgi:hypothetical protein
MTPTSKDSRHAAAALRAFVAAREDVFGRTLDFDQFYTELDPLESARVGALWRLVSAVVGGDRDAALSEAEHLVRSMPDEDDAQGAVVVRTFGEAVLGRLRAEGSAGGNLYLGARPPGAQLRAFELLRLRTPLIPFAYAAANRALLAAVPQRCPVTLVDVGIGRGGQLRTLLRNPNARELFESLHVVGIEPDSESAAGTGALELARQQVEQIAEEVGIKVAFTPISKRAEELTAADFPPLNGLVIGNAAFALHHVEHDGAAGRDRTAVLQLLGDVGVQSLVLVEPDTNHFTDDLEVRFLYAYRHYRTVAASLGSLLAPADAFLVWQEFFAPEVRNVMGYEGSLRTERHQEAGVWADHLRAAGWDPQRPGSLVARAATPPGFALGLSSTACSLDYRGVPLLSVLRAERAG